MRRNKLLCNTPWDNAGRFVARRPLPAFAPDIAAPGLAVLYVTAPVPAVRGGRVSPVPTTPRKALANRLRAEVGYVPPSVQMGRVEAWLERLPMGRSSASILPRPRVNRERSFTPGASVYSEREVADGVLRQRLVHQRRLGTVPRHLINPGRLIF